MVLRQDEDHKKEAAEKEQRAAERRKLIQQVQLKQIGERALTGTGADAVPLLPEAPVEEMTTAKSHIVTARSPKGKQAAARDATMSLEELRMNKQLLEEIGRRRARRTTVADVQGMLDRAEHSVEDTNDTAGPLTKRNVVPLHRRAPSVGRRPAKAIRATASGIITKKLYR